MPAHGIATFQANTMAVALPRQTARLVRLLQGRLRVTRARWILARIITACIPITMLTPVPSSGVLPGNGGTHPAGIKPTRALRVFVLGSRPPVRAVFWAFSLSTQASTALEMGLSLHDML